MKRREFLKLCGVTAVAGPQLLAAPPPQLPPEVEVLPSPLTINDIPGLTVTGFTGGGAEQVECASAGDIKVTAPGREFPIEILCSVTTAGTLAVRDWSLSIFNPATGRIGLARDYKRDGTVTFNGETFTVRGAWVIPQSLEFCPYGPDAESVGASFRLMTDSVTDAGGNPIDVEKVMHNHFNFNKYAGPLIRQTLPTRIG